MATMELGESHINSLRVLANSRLHFLKQYVLSWSKRLPLQFAEVPYAHPLTQKVSILFLHQLHPPSYPHYISPNPVLHAKKKTHKIEHSKKNDNTNNSFFKKYYI